MLDDKDVQKLKEELATKKDLEMLVTKEDLEKFSIRAFQTFATKEEIIGLKEEVANLRENIQALTVAVDKLAKSVEDFRQEYIAITSKVDRHEKWIRQIAEKLGIKLEY